jgi:hypothetical protein
MAELQIVQDLGPAGLVGHDSDPAQELIQLELLDENGDGPVLDLGRRVAEQRLDRGARELQATVAIHHRNDIDRVLEQ